MKSATASGTYPSCARSWKTFCLGTVSSMTSRSRTTLKTLDAARLSEIRYRRLFEAAQEGVLLVDPGTHRITDANPFMAELLGYTREEFLERELCQIGLFQNEAACEAA